MPDAVKVTKDVWLSAVFQIVHTVHFQRTLTVSMIHLVNASNAAVTVQVCLVANGGTPGGSNALLWNFSIPANDFIEFGAGLLMPPSSSLQALAGSGSSIGCFLSGIEE